MYSPKKFHEIGPWFKILCNLGCWTFPWCLHSFYGPFLLTNERKRKTSHFEWKTIQILWRNSFISLILLCSFFSFFLFFLLTNSSNYEFEGCTKKKSVTMIIEVIYVVWLLFDSTKHDDAAICRLVFIHFGATLFFIPSNWTGGLCFQKG